MCDVPIVQGQIAECVCVCVFSSQYICVMIQFVLHNIVSQKQYTIQGISHEKINVIQYSESFWFPRIFSALVHNSNNVRWKCVCVGLPEVISVSAADSG